MSPGNAISPLADGQNHLQLKTTGLVKEAPSGTKETGLLLLLLLLISVVVRALVNINNRRRY